MLKGKIFGIVFGGIGGFLLLNKGMNILRESISNVCEANKWKNYYKYGKDGMMVPPGYSSHTHKMTDRPDTEMVIEDERQTKKDNQDASQDSPGAVFARSVMDAIKDKLDGSKAPEEASEGQTEAFNECVSDCADCTKKDECIVSDIPIEYTCSVEDTEEENETLD